jgi:hypothetical protein
MIYATTNKREDNQDEIFSKILERLDKLEGGRQFYKKRSSKKA